MGIIFNKAAWAANGFGLMLTLLGVVGQLKSYEYYPLTFAGIATCLVGWLFTLREKKEVT